MTLINKLLRIVSLLSIAAGLVLIGLIASYYYKNQNAVQNTIFVPVSSQSKLVSDKPIITGNPVKLVIPSLNISLPIINGSYNSQSKQWTLTPDKVQYANPSQLPNNVGGNTLLYGHNNKNVFASLHLVEPGANAQVITDNGYTFTYHFASTQALEPTDTAILKYEGVPRLTLQTCSGSFFQHRQMYYFTFDKFVKTN